MKFTIAAALALAASAVSAGYANVTTVTIPCEVTTTEVVTAYTTYCPEPTTIVEKNVTYTITKPGTVTITDCPCTRSKTYTTTTVTTCPVVSGTPVLPSTVKPIVPTSTPSKNVTVPSTSSNATSNITLPTATISQGGASSFGVSGVIAGAVAIVAYLI